VLTTCYSGGAGEDIEGFAGHERLENATSGETQKNQLKNAISGETQKMQFQVRLKIATSGETRKCNFG
jgi:hypothetical protein